MVGCDRRQLQVASAPAAVDSFGGDVTQCAMRLVPLPFDWLAIFRRAQLSAGLAAQRRRRNTRGGCCVPTGEASAACAYAGAHVGMHVVPSEAALPKHKK